MSRNLTIELNTSALEPRGAVERTDRILVNAYGLLKSIAANRVKNLDDAYNILFAAFGNDGDWIVYKGGHHVALIADYHHISVSVLTVKEAQ